MENNCVNVMTISCFRPAHCLILFKLTMKIFVPLRLLFVLDAALGQFKNIFMAKHRNSIQEYIMTGRERGWQNCDILSVNPSDLGVPHILMSMGQIQNLNIKSVFKNSHCLLVNYDVCIGDSLSNLLQFSWEAAYHVRLALVMKICNGLTFETATNTSTLPYLVATESESNVEKFICPVVGEIKPRLENEICNPSYLKYKNKALRVGLLGVPPDFVLTKTGVEGINIRLIKMMAKKLKFLPNIKFASSFKGAEDQSSNREIDISIVKYTYNSLRNLRNDYIGPVGSYDFHFISAAPPERKEYLTLTRPFDSITWAFIAASVVGVSITLILIDKVHARRSRENSTIFQSKDNR